MRGKVWKGRAAFRVVAGLGLALAASPCAAISFDIARHSFGRTTYPAQSWALDIFPVFTARDLRDGTQDSLNWSVELEHGRTDRLSLEAGLKGKTARGDSLRPDRLLFEARYLVLREPFQFTPFIEYLPSLRSRGTEWEFGFETQKNMGPWCLSVDYEGELEKEDGEMELESSASLGPYYRFGLQGLAGPLWVYKADGSHALGFFLGGALSPNVFLALEPMFGLNKKAPDLAVTLQVNLYVGAYALGSHIFE